MATTSDRRLGARRRMKEYDAETNNASQRLERNSRVSSKMANAALGPEEKAKEGQEIRAPGEHVKGLPGGRSEALRTLNPEQRKAQLRQQISETMARVRKLTEEDRARQERPAARSGCGSGAADKIFAKGASDDSPRNRVPRYDPESPFEDRKYSPRSVEGLGSNPQKSEGRRRRSPRTSVEVSPSQREAHVSAAFETGADGQLDSDQQRVTVLSRTRRDRELIEERSKISKGNRPSRGDRRKPSSDAKLSTFSEASTSKEGPERSSMRHARPSADQAMDSKPETDAIASSLSPPSRRTEHQNDDPHPSSVSPRSLSKETSRALASLEATLARLEIQKADHSKGEMIDEPKPSISRSSHPPSRRALSPSKELYARERLSKDHHWRQSLEENVQGDARAKEVPREKMSFLARVERMRSMNASSLAKDAEAKSDKAMQAQGSFSDGDGGRTEACVQTSAESSRRRSRYLHFEAKRVDDKEMRYGSDATGMEMEKSKDKSQNSKPTDSGNNLGEKIHRGQWEKEADHKAKLFLSGTTILVDVRDQDGEDVSKLWIDRLREAGAKVFAKPPQATRKKRDGGSADSARNRQVKSGQDIALAVDYIVYKHGRPATNHYYRSQMQAGNAPPTVVGVNWIVHCLREAKKVDSRDYLVEIGKSAVLATPSRGPSAMAKTRPCNTADDDDSDSDGGGGSAVEVDKGNAGWQGLMARKKFMQNAPARPSPLASRAWNLDNSTSSIATTATLHTVRSQVTSHSTTTMTTS